jgi:regulator of replication initiation timing
MKNKIIEAILKLNPTAQVSVSKEDINSIVWENGTSPISKEQILAILPQVEKEINAINNRVKEYGSWQSQLDEIYHEGLDAWKTRIASIKAKYPK